MLLSGGRAMIRRLLQVAVVIVASVVLAAAPSGGGPALASSGLVVRTTLAPSRASAQVRKRSGGASRTRPRRWVLCGGGRQQP